MIHKDGNKIESLVPSIVWGGTRVHACTYTRLLKTSPMILIRHKSHEFKAKLESSNKV